MQQDNTVCSVTCTRKFDRANPNLLLLSLERGEGSARSGMQEELGCLHAFIFSKVSSEGMCSATYLAFLFNMRTELFSCTLLVSPQSRGPLAPGSTSPEGCDLIGGFQRSSYTSLSHCVVVVVSLLFHFLKFLIYFLFCFLAFVL